MWTEERVRAFWENNKAVFAGDTTATEIIRLSRKHIKGRVLDIGAGSGALIDRLSNAVGVDLVPRHSRIMVGSIAALPFENAEFETIFATDVLEHLSNQILGVGLAETSRVLKQGGKLIVVVPYKEDFDQSMVLCPGCGETFHRWGHTQTFDAQTLVTELNKCQLRVINIAVLPLGLMAEHRIIRYFYPLFVRVGFIKVHDLFVVAEKE